MSSAASQPQLRLVGMSDDGRAWRESEQARLAVVKENRIAAHSGALQPESIRTVDARDPRWILAMQTRARLQGTTLTPERREQLMRSGKTLGLRPFETNLVIAIVQDQARRGGTDEHAAPLLSLVRAAAADSPTKSAVWPKWFAAIAAAAAVAAALIRWLAA